MPKNTKNKLKTDKPLSDRHQAFVNEYCSNGMNATQAYKKIYPKVKGGWDKLAGRLMGKDGIREAIKAKLEDKAEKLDITTEYVLKKIIYGLNLAIERGDLASIARFTDQLSKYKGMFTTNIHQTGDGLTINVADKGQEQPESKAKLVS